MKITDIYKMLCNFYGINDAVDIEPYLITKLPTQNEIVLGNRECSREALLIREVDNDFEMALFIDKIILRHLADENPLLHLDELSCAVEGVSHFLYVTDRICKNKKLSMLEIELQGEVDKFLIMNLIAKDCGGRTPQILFNQQFEQCKYAHDLSDNERERYSSANHFASKYCYHLLKRFFNPLKFDCLSSEARTFYHKDLEQKLQRLIP